MKKVYTIGHSNRPISEFLKPLQANGIELAVDIRTIPRSRQNPQYEQKALKESLKGISVSYLHLPGLGGLRHPIKDSPNAAWRNDSFRGYADYMQTEGFERALGELMKLAAKSKVAIFCAEAVPWRCHRSLVADALLARGFEVEHIFSAGHTTVHRMTPWARIEGERITYPKGRPAGYRRERAAARSRRRHPVRRSA
jgi:uncharacterized protein (DUF488 family)